MPRSPSAVAPGSERYPAELCAIVSGARDHLREHPRDSGFALAPLDTGGHVDEPECTIQDDVWRDTTRSSLFGDKTGFQLPAGV